MLTFDTQVFYYETMQFQIESPTRAYICGHYTAEELETLREELTYTNDAAAHDVKRHYNAHWMRRKDPDAWQKKLDQLKVLVKNTLVFEDNGRYYIRPSSLHYLNPIKYQVIGTSYKFPEPKKMAWAKVLPFELYDYQQLSVDKLIEVKHGNVELCTGAGKSAILLKLCRETGFRCAVVAPSKSIFNELLEKFEYHLGRGNVGTFGDGKKKLGKRITICIADSLVNIEKDTEEWQFFSGLDMLCVDESHTWGADTLENICHGIFADVPYRFFMSGTQTRGDGTELLLHSIIGPTVHTLTTAEAIKGGYICNHNYCIVDTESSNPNHNSSEPLEEKRIHFLNNRNIAAFIAKLANLAAAEGQQTLILVEELSQIAMIKKLITVPMAIAHATKKKDELFRISLTMLKPEDRKRLLGIMENLTEDEKDKKDKIKRTIIELGIGNADPAESVEAFNKGEAMVLVGTSCIATGTNIYPMRHTFNWVGSASEIKTKQGAVGRSVRLGNQNPYKEKCAKKEIVTIWDFNVHDIQTMRRHLEARLACYYESGTEVKRINLNAQKIQAGGVR